MGEPTGIRSSNAADAFPFFLVAPNADGAVSDEAATAAPERARHRKHVGGCGPRAGAPPEGQKREQASG